ncbi:transposase [Geobacter sulfurreducens]|nr:transposase, Y1_Tnp domain-containing [Geobacter sulfurreducens KN400]AJY69037.1 transposase [Geobacter sulfurreducens]QVW34589.1 transposase [Geobacter sulfurreducens]
MARKPRIHYPGALYHVILRGNARQDIFHDPEDRYRFYLFLQEGSERFGHRILAFCLMTNHVHLAVQVGEVPLSRFMQNITFRYTRWQNWRMGKTGHLFQGRYKSFLVDGDAYLQELVAYIHLNPVRAGMTTKLGNYTWSSHRAYLGKEIIPWLNTETVLATYSSDTSTARKQYATFISDRVKEGHREEFHGKGSSDSRVIGDDHFVEAILERADRLPLRRPGLDMVVEVIKRLYSLQEEELASPGQKRWAAEARGVAAWAVQEFSSATLTDLAKRFGRDVSSMSAAVRRLEQRRKTDQGIDERLKRVGRELEGAICQA